MPTHPNEIGSLLDYVGREMAVFITALQETIFSLLFILLTVSSGLLLMMGLLFLGEWLHQRLSGRHRQDK